MTSYTWLKWFCVYTFIVNKLDFYSPSLVHIRTLNNMAFAQEQVVKSLRQHTCREAGCTDSEKPTDYWIIIGKMLIPNVFPGVLRWGKMMLEWVPWWTAHTHMYWKLCLPVPVKSGTYEHPLFAIHRVSQRLWKMTEEIGKQGALWVFLHSWGFKHLQWLHSFSPLR